MVKLMKWKVNIVLNCWKEKFMKTKWIRMTKRGQYSNNIKLEIYVQMIKRDGGKGAINKKITI